jgi:hypothetical protein
MNPDYTEYKVGDMVEHLISKQRAFVLSSDQEEKSCIVSYGFGKENRCTVNWCEIMPVNSGNYGI